MHVEMRPIASIRPYANNPRLNDAAVDAMVQSIREFGFRQPIVVDPDGVIVVGHTRYKAALKLGLTEVPVHVAVGLTKAQLKAYRIADNQIAQLSGWDEDKLPLELMELQALDFDLNLTGFSADELLDLFQDDAPAGRGDPDAVPEPPDEAVTQPGDLWLLGDHRLLCGDSSQAEDMDRLVRGAPIHLVNTDPPYNVRVEPRSNRAIAAGLSSFTGTTHHQGFDVARHPEKAQSTHTKMRAKDRPLVNDFVSEVEFDRLLQAWFGNLARVLQPGRGFYIWGGYANIANYPAVLKAHELYMSQTIIWDKQHSVLARKDYMGAHEWCFYGWKLGAAHQFFGPNNATDLWAIKKVNPQNMIHLTEKPVELAARKPDSVIGLVYESAGGRRPRSNGTAARRLQTAQDVIDLLQEQVEALRAEMQADAIQKARALGYLAELARKAIETGSLAARIEALEVRRNDRNDDGK